MSEPADLVYSVQEAAVRLKCSPHTVYALVYSGVLRARRLGRQRVIRIPADALAAYIAGTDFEEAADGTQAQARGDRLGLPRR